MSTDTRRKSSTHRAYMGEGYYVTVQHCEGPGTDGTGCDAYLGTNYPADLCPACKSLTGPVTASCGCPLDGPCTMHRDNDGHRHCTTCGVPVHVYDTYEDGTVEYDDHDCPPGFLPRPGETAPANACRATSDS